MRSMVLTTTGPFGPGHVLLHPTDLPLPTPSDAEVLLKISVCGVCHTELDEIEGRTPPPSLPVVPGHQAVGTVERIGKKVSDTSVGERVGVAWIFSACGTCSYCRAGRENLCAQFLATGRDAHGGYAEYMTVPAAFLHSIPEPLKDAEAAPLLCAGAVGYRALRLTGLADRQTLGLTGFGASGHLVLKMARHLCPDSDIYVFARSESERRFALDLGAAWAGDTSAVPPRLLDAIIDTTPVWSPVVTALQHLAPGGRLVINAIRKEDVDKQKLVSLDYGKHLWMEKEIKSVANVTRADVRDCLKLAVEAEIRPETQSYSLEDANEALLELKQKKIRGAKVLQIAQ